MTPIPLVTVLPGANPFKEGNVNETFRGQVLLADQSVRAAILKDLDPRQLANELLVAMLGRAVGLPVPEVALGRAAPADLPAKHGPTLDDGSRLIFVSCDVRHPNLMRVLNSATSPAALTAIMADVLTWPMLGRLYGFDAWVANIDRHPGNLLFGGKHDIWLIDHGHCFSGPTWTGADLDAERPYTHRLSEWVTAHLQPEERKRRSSEVDSCANEMAKLDVSAAAAGSHIADLLPAGDVVAVVSFLQGRVAHVPRHANTALGLPSLL